MDITYNEFINNILATRGRFACGDEYHERHHIVPKCMGGTNDEDNLIDLFAREHFEAHRLLTLENPENDKLAYALWCMSHIKGNKNQDRYMVTPEEYEESRIMFSKQHSIQIKGDNHPFYGRHHTNETKKRISEFNQGEKNYFYGKHYFAENNGFYGKRHNEESKKKMSDAKKIPIICVNTLTIYISAKDASINTGINPGNIRQACKGNLKTAGGYSWSYVYDYVCKDGTTIPGAITLGLITEEDVNKQLTVQN